MQSYLNDTVAVGLVMINKEGHDEMVVFHGVIQKNTSGLFLDIKDQAPMEMSEKWLAKLKPVEASMGERFQGAKHCLIIASVSKPEN